MDEHKLFVGNMAARITQRDLWRFFSPYGMIDECAKFHESYAFVRFVHADDALRARHATHGAMLKGRKLKVEFAATMNKTNATPWNQQKYLFVQPLRRPVNVPACCSQPIRSPMASARTITKNRTCPTEFSSDEEFRTPDLLRLAGIPCSSFDDGYETNSSPVLNSCFESRFFPISIRRPNPMPDQNDRRTNDMHFLSLDFTRIRLFSDVSSGFGDDSNSFSE